MMGTQAAGSAAQEARSEGASTDRALLYGVTSGLLETVTEGISGGIPGLGGGVASDVARKILSSPVAAKLLDIAGEGGEEAVSAFLTPYIKRAIYAPDTPNATAEEIVQSAIQGMIAAGVLQAGIELPGAVENRVADVKAARRALGSNEDIIGRVNNRLAGPGQVEADLEQAGAGLGRRPEILESRARWLPTGRETAGEQQKTASRGEKENTRLTDSDLPIYLKVGDRQHVRNAKDAQLKSGSSPILTTLGQIRNFIASAIRGEIRNEIKGYGRVGSKMAADIISLAKAKYDIGDVTGYYLELDANRLGHLSDHILDDGDVRNIPLTETQVLNLVDYIDNYDDVLDVVKKKDGSVRVTLGKQIGNGYIIVIELVSKGRRSLQPVTAWQNTTEHYLKKYRKNKMQINTSQPTTFAEGPSGYKPTSYDTTLPRGGGGVNIQNTQTGGQLSGAGPLPGGNKGYDLPGGARGPEGFGPNTVGAAESGYLSAPEGPPVAQEERTWWLPTGPIINLSTEDIAALTRGVLPGSRNYLRETALDRAGRRLGIDENRAAYIPVNHLRQGSEEYVVKISQASLHKLLPPTQGGAVSPEAIVVLENIEQVISNGVCYQREGWGQGRNELAGRTHLTARVYIDGEPYVVDIRGHVYGAPSGGENRVTFFVPEDMSVTKK